MPTKAQEFRTAQQRAAHPPEPRRARRPRRDVVVDTALPGVSATDRKRLRGRTRTLLAGRRGGAATEDATSARPSRKSTRKSSDGTKRTTNQQLEAVRKSTSPTAAATRAQATKPVRGRGAPAAGSRGPGRR